MVTEADI